MVARPGTPFCFPVKTSSLVTTSPAVFVDASAKRHDLFLALETLLKGEKGQKGAKG
jgi:hypothetical protein